MHCSSSQLSVKSTGCTLTLHRRHLQHKTVRICCSASRPSENSGSAPIRGQTPIGAEYGEGFEVFDTSRSLYHVDVAALNKSLRITGAQRLRHSMKPDEAVGAIFVLDGVLVDTRPLREESWSLLAQENDHPIPDTTRPQMHDLPPEKIIIEVLRWTHDVAVARRLAHRLSEIYAALFTGLDRVKSGVLDWLTALESANVPCAVISEMSRIQVDLVLERLNLHRYFSNSIVSFEDDMETTAQRYLCAAMKLGRPPEQCVAFDASPIGVAASHNVSMKTVALQGLYKGYQLKQADLTCASLDELTVYNLRRLFANKGLEFMDHKKAKDVEGNKKRKNFIATF
eukprot:g1667.t1